MDSLSFPTIILGTLIFLLIFNLWKLKNSSHKIKGKKIAPEPSFALPLLGHLHLLGAQAPLARTLASFADKYGPIFTIRLGAFPALVVSNQEAIKECFTTNDKILASRPKSSHGVHLGYNFAGFGFAPDGKYWRNLRKLVMLELLSTRRLDSLKHVIESEVSSFIKDLYLYLRSNAPCKVVVSEWLERLTFNVITRMVSGKRYFGNLQDVDNVEANRVVKLIKEFMHVSGEFVPSDLIPVFGLFKFEGRALKSLKRIGKDVDELVGGWVEEHSVKRKKESNENEQDFIDVMLSVIEEDSTWGHTRETVIKATISSLILAGSDTTSLTMTWVLALLMNNRHALNRAKEEIDLHVGRNKWVETSDFKKLIYLQAIIKETLRLYPPGPLLVPHEATEDCYISGYFVPKGTRVFANVWKLHRDPTIWSEPEKFKPERFITNSGEIDESLNFEYLPFGSGRRACPGSAFATQVSVLTVARLIQGFEMEVPMNEAVDMREGMGITLPKATPLEILLTPRLSSELY